MVNGIAHEVEERRAVKTLKPKLPEHCTKTFTYEAKVCLWIACMTYLWLRLKYTMPITRMPAFR